jgi:hypothetical protein
MCRRVRSGSGRDTRRGYDLLARASSAVPGSGPPGGETRRAPGEGLVACMACGLPRGGWQVAAGITSWRGRPSQRQGLRPVGGLGGGGLVGGRGGLRGGTVLRSSGGLVDRRGHRLALGLLGLLVGVGGGGVPAVANLRVDQALRAGAHDAVGVVAERTLQAQDGLLGAGTEVTVHLDGVAQRDQLLLQRRDRFPLGTILQHLAHSLHPSFAVLASRAPCAPRDATAI